MDLLELKMFECYLIEGAREMVLVEVKTTLKFFDGPMDKSK